MNLLIQPILPITLYEENQNSNPDPPERIILAYGVYL
jgi:hypothetical protein